MQKELIPTFTEREGTALVRCDFNIPLNGEDLSKIDDIKDTLNALKNNRVILMTHLGDPDKYEERYSLRNILPYIEQRLSEKVELCNLDEIDSATERIVLLENIRFFEEEKKNDSHFAERLSNIGDFYINDAFAVCHRKHASLDAITKYLPSYIGYNMKYQIDRLTPLLDKEYIWIIGGKKVDTKLKCLNSNITCILAGAVANTYFQRQGYEIGSSYFQDCEIPDFREIFAPVDVIVKDEKNKLHTIDIRDMRHNFNIIDIGHKTLSLWQTFVKNKNCIWNGSISLDENSENQNTLMKFISDNCNISIIGGGNMPNLDNYKLTYHTTAGSALLYFMSNRVFPISIYQ